MVPVEYVMTKLIFLFVLVFPSFTASQDLPAQPSVSKPADKRCDFSEIFRYEGWKIPGLKGATPKGNRVDLARFHGVFATELNAGKSDLILVAPECVDNTPGRLAVRTWPVRVLELWRFDFNGKVFAYAADYEPQSIVDGIPHQTLKLVSVLFYDVDGSGLFKIMKYDSPGPIHSLEVPEWAKKSST